MEVSRKVWLSEMAMLLVAMIWGGTFVAAQFAQETIPTFWILAIRFILAGLMMSLIFWKEWKKLDRKTIRYGATIGLLLFLGIGVQMVGLKFTILCFGLLCHYCSHLGVDFLWEETCQENFFLRHPMYHRGGALKPK